jgi:hypothetical protein
MFKETFLRFAASRASVVSATMSVCSNLQRERNRIPLPTIKEIQRRVRRGPQRVTFQLIRGRSHPCLHRIVRGDGLHFFPDKGWNQDSLIDIGKNPNMHDEH